MLSENIRNYRKKNNLTQEELASRLHIVRQTVSKWEKGYSVPDADLLQKLAAEFNVSVSDLLGEVCEANSDEESIPEQLEIINDKLARLVRTRKRIYKAAAVILILTAAVLIFIKFTYLNPCVAYSVSKPCDAQTDRYFEHITLCYQTKLNFPLNKETKELLSEFVEKSRAIHNDIDNNYEAPMHIEITVVTDKDYSVVTYSGTATKDGKQVEYVNNFFVMKELEPAK